MNIYLKTLILLILVFYFSCDNDVTGNGALCTADPVGEWSGVTRTIEYAEECASHCSDYDLSYQEHYEYCSELITLIPGMEEFLCTSKQIVFYENLDCYDYLDPITNPIAADPPCFINDGSANDCGTQECQAECNDKGDICIWGGAGVAHCVSNCEATNQFLDCEWDAINLTCEAPDIPTQTDRLINLLACNDSDSKDSGSNCLWDGEGLGDDNDSDGVLFEGNCGWGIELEVESNIESEFYAFDEDGNFSITGESEDTIGDYSCSEDNVELCEEGDCEIWPFTQEDGQATIYIEDYSDEYTDYKEECTATGTIIIQKNNN